MSAFYFSAAGNAGREGQLVVREKTRVMACRLHCIFGKPLRPISIDSAILTLTVVSVAQAAYDERILPSGERGPIRLEVLADALGETGAADGLVEHLRGPGPHWRGCHVIDALTGRS